MLYQAEFVTIDNFAPYGSIVSPNQEIERRETDTSANQGTAIKLVGVSPTANNFSESNTLPVPTAPNLNIFRCFPRPHMAVGNFHGVKHEIKVLEKHPYSTQTFIPMGRDSLEIGYLVVVALQREDADMPDLSTLKAFIFKGTEAVTYGAGVWHAPMIPMGTQPYLDFTVVIFENHVLDDNLAECFYEDEIVVQIM